MAWLWKGTNYTLVNNKYKIIINTTLQPGFKMLNKCSCVSEDTKWVPSLLLFVAICLTTNIVLEICKDAEIEPKLLSPSGEELCGRTTNRSNEARIDTTARGRKSAWNNYFKRSRPLYESWIWHNYWDISNKVPVFILLKRRRNIP